MNRICAAAAVLLILLGASAAFAESTVPSRRIHLVYDDSGSMIRMGDKYVDTWCQAKYAMEVVAAMLGERDTLSVYYMSDYDEDTQAAPRIQLRGSRDAKTVAANVETIHNTITKFGNTPFNAVRKAASDLRQVTADERWLVVLTDGEFEDGRMTSKQVEQFYDEFTADGSAKVIMLAMGPEAASISADERRGIYFEHAATTNEILPSLTTICNRIFQRNALKVKENNRKYEIYFGVPMKQLVVFAQGRDARIGENISSGDRVFAQSSNVHATYSTQSSIQNPPGAVIADKLNGYVATFDGEFAPGAYVLDVKNADSIDVYYKPNVAIDAYLYDADGVEVTEKSDIVNGSYRLEFGFVDASNHAKVEDSSLLGKIEFVGTVTNTATDGTVTAISASSGDAIALREGKVEIDVTARYLDYNSVRTKLSFDVFFRNALAFEVGELPAYRVTKDGLSGADTPFALTVKMKDGERLVELTPDQWEAMEAPSVTAQAPLGDFRIEKGAQLGEFLVYPALAEGDPFKVAPSELSFTVSGGFSRGKSSAAGRLESKIAIGDGITPLERIIRWWEEHWKIVAGILAAGILIIGYVKKRRFSRLMANNPVLNVEDRQNRRRRRKDELLLSGTFKKKFASRVLPFVDEAGELSMGPDECPKFQLKASRCGMVLLDTHFVLNHWKELRLDGEKVGNPDNEDELGRIRYEADDSISYVSGGKTYTCNLKLDKKDIDREDG